MTDGTQPNAPAGWYPDPQNPGQQRYWDGNAWVDPVAPVPQQSEPAAVAPNAPAADTVTEQPDDTGDAPVMPHEDAAMAQPASAPPAEPTRTHAWNTFHVLGAAVIALLIGGAIGFAIGNSSKKKNTASSALTNTSPSDTTPDTSEPDTTPLTETPTTVPAPPTFTVGQKVEYENGASIQVFSYQPNVVPNDSFETPQAGMSFAVIDVQFCTGTDAASYNDLGFKAKMADNREYDSTISVKDPDLGSGDLPAGSGCKRGYVTLSIPQGQQPTALLWDYSGWQLTTWTLK
jgi:hypothetical protein